MIISEIDAAECRLPLPKPIRLGPVEITTRDFVVVRLKTDTGLHGDAIGYPRGSSLLESVRRMAPFVLGTDLNMRRKTIDNFLQSFVNGRAGFVKAASLVDIALWDLAAKASEQPLWHMLGGFRAHAPVMVVAGYYLDQRTIEDVCDEVRARVDEGYTRIKIMISGTDTDLDARLVEQAMNIAGDRICLDAHWVFRNIDQAYQVCRRLDRLGVRFIEDPFAPYQSNLTAQLQSRLKTPLTFGEDLPDPQSFVSALRDVPILRLDATTCGGVSAFMGLSDMAGYSGRSVLPHVFTSIHTQLAGASQAVEAVEFIPLETGACPIFDLLKERPTMESGTVTMPQTPGAGQTILWNAVERFARKNSFRLTR